jgi:O-antigen ligase
VAAHRISSTVIQAGTLAVVLAALPYKLFELDRYFVPKEVVLHAAALLLGIGLLLRTRRFSADTADSLLAVFVGWSLLSAIFATNHWLAQRALGVSVSSAVIFWSARKIGQDGAYRRILAGAAIAGVIAAATTLIQAYGFETDYFSQNRAPGGTFGNRNFAAHFAAIALPSLVYCALTARSAAVFMTCSVGALVVAVALVLTRSRAAWLAVAVTVAAVTIPLIASRSYWRGIPVVGRLLRLAGVTAAGVALAIFLPNSLNWRSESPYLDSARGVVDYSSGSGRGRLAQYFNSMRISRDDPLFGVGPGNWPVKYPDYAPDGDPSLTNSGMTANPWPSSDWVAFMSERGIVAAAALLGVFVVLFFGAMRRWSALPGAEDVLARVTQVGTIAATMVVSAFDAALLLAAPAFLAWSVIGATSGIARSGREVAPERKWWMTGLFVTLAIVMVSLARSIGQVASILQVGTGGTRAGWIAAARWDPGSYRIHERVAQLHMNRGSCRSARPYARRAQSLFPNAPGPRRILRSCD